MPPYTVPTERTPLTYQIVLDLSIPASGGCPEAMQKIPTDISNVFGPPRLGAPPVTDHRSVDGHRSPDGDAGVPCRQSPYRALDAVNMGDQVKKAAATWPEKHQRYFLLYFNNLQAALPNSMVQSFSDFTQNLAMNPPPGDFQAMLWPWGPPAMTSSYPGWNMQPMSWSTEDDPNFIGQLTDFAKKNLPLISEIQDPNQPVPLLSDDDAQKYDGGLIRLCTISITPPDDGGLQMVGHDAQGKLTVLPMASQYPVKAGDPPSVPAQGAAGMGGTRRRLHAPQGQDSLRDLQAILRPRVHR